MKMTWLGNVLIEALATMFYIFVMFPLWLALNILIMILVVFLLPLKIPAINRYIMKQMKL